MLPQPLIHSLDRFVAVLALARAGWGLWLGLGDPNWSENWHLPTFSVLLCFVGCWLHVGQRESERGRLLALALVAAGSGFATTPLATNGDKFLASLKLEAFFGWYLWRFVEQIPEAHDTPTLRRALHVGQLVSLLIALAGIGLWLREGGPPPAVNQETPATLADKFDPRAWALASMGAVFVFGLRYRRATKAEKRRNKLLLYAFAALAATLVVIALPDMDGQEEPMKIFGLGAIFIFVGFMAYTWIAQGSQPFRRRVLRLALYRAVQVSLWIASLTPLVFIARHFDGGRVADAGERSLAYWALAAVAAGALRPLALRALKRRFEGRQVETTHWLPNALSELGATRDASSLSEWVARTTRQQLRTGDAKLCFLSENAVAGSDSLPAASRLPEIFDLRKATYNREKADPFDTEERLTHEDRRLLDTFDTALIAPVRAVDGKLLGLLVLSTKATEGAYRANEVAAVDFLASSIGLHLERLRYTYAPPIAAEEDCASVCRRCSRVYPAEVFDCPDCELPTFSADIPRKIGRFLLEHRLGSGSFGSVYAARDLDLHRPVAIKSLDATRSSGEALAREAAAAARLSHPHVAVAYSLERWQGRRLLVTELLEGGTLKDLLNEGPLDQLRAVSIAIQVAEALRAAHDLGFTHGDIKPSNIGFTEEGSPKLIDLGLVAALNESGGSSSAASSELASTRALPGGAMGTPLYASPEVFAGNPGGSTDDLWALNVVLWECLTGSNPFAVGDLESVGRAVIAGCQKDPRRAGAQCSDELATLLSKGLAAHVSHRHVDAEDLLAELQGVL